MTEDRVSDPADCIRRDCEKAVKRHSSRDNNGWGAKRFAELGSPKIRRETDSRDERRLPERNLRPGLEL